MESSSTSGVPKGFEICNPNHPENDNDDEEHDFDDNLSLGSMGDMSLVTLGSTLEQDFERNTNHSNSNNQKNNSDNSSDKNNNNNNNKDGPVRGDGSVASSSVKDRGENKHSQQVKQPNNYDNNNNQQQQAPQEEPRMVSADSMATIRHANVRQQQQRQQQQQPPSQMPLKGSGAGLTPYDSLKDLIKSKKRQRDTTTTSIVSAGSSQANASNNGSTGGGMVSRPSTFLRQALYGSNYTPRPNQSFEDQDEQQKRARIQKEKQEAEAAATEVQNPLLHKACMKQGVEADVIEAILKIDRNLAAKSQSIYYPQSEKPYFEYDFCQQSFVWNLKLVRIQEKYAYPVNIALKNRAKAAAVELLVRAAPRITALADGPMKECSLSILLKHYVSPHQHHQSKSDLDPNSSDGEDNIESEDRQLAKKQRRKNLLIRDAQQQLADLLLLSNPSCAKTRDYHQNTPLHIACQYGAPLSIVKNICILYPPALRVKNRFGHTPLQVAQRSYRSNPIATYLLGKQRGVYS